MTRENFEKEWEPYLIVGAGLMAERANGIFLGRKQAGKQGAELPPGAGNVSPAALRFLFAQADERFLRQEVGGRGDEDDADNVERVGDEQLIRADAEDLKEAQADDERKIVGDIETVGGLADGAHSVAEEAVVEFPVAEPGKHGDQR